MDTEEKQAGVSTGLGEEMTGAYILDWGKSWSDEEWVTSYALRFSTFWILDCGFGIYTSFAIRIPKSEIQNE